MERRSKQRNKICSNFVNYCSNIYIFIFNILNIMKNILHPQDFFPYFGKEIIVYDNRSKTMPTTFSGTLIGIRENEVEIRRNNVMTQWYPINFSNIIFEFK